MQHNSEGTTIASIATPPGKGSIAVVRLSGPQTFQIADAVFCPIHSEKSVSAAAGYTALFGHYLWNNSVCDETVALVFRAPHSYTGEDVVELSCHGGNAAVRGLLEACLHAGAVMAAPGEYTRRAFLNGKLSLEKAEAVMDLVDAENRQAACAAQSAMSGSLWSEIDSIREQLLTVSGHISAWIDYPEEDVPALEDGALLQTLTAVKNRLQKLVEGYDRGVAIRRGISTVLVGSPNVGKSTLLNLLTGQDTAIVTPVAGTTRDIVEETITLDGITLHLADTAGLHDTSDIVEQEGIRRSKARMEKASLILAVFDLSVPLTEEDRKLSDSLAAPIAGRSVLFLLNKNDLPAAWQPQELFPNCKELPAMLLFSAHGSMARAELEKALIQLLKLEDFDPDAALLANRRQLNCVRQAMDAVDGALQAHALGLDLDAVGVCLQDALSSLYSLTGENVSDTVVDEVFSKFCVGK